MYTADDPQAFQSLKNKNTSREKCNLWKRKARCINWSSLSKKLFFATKKKKKKWTRHCDDAQLKWVEPKKTRKANPYAKKEKKKINWYVISWIIIKPN